jgi:hypothetical protein
MDLSYELLDKAFNTSRSNYGALSGLAKEFSL